MWAAEIHSCALGVCLVMWFESFPRNHGQAPLFNFSFHNYSLGVTADIDIHVLITFNTNFILKRRLNNKDNFI